MNYESSPDSSAERKPSSSIPRIDLNLEEHKLSIAINWSILVITSSFLPIILYFSLRYASSLSLKNNIAITTSIFGVFSLFALAKRTWLLLRKDSTCRPLGGSRWAMDYFNWNFLLGFIALTILISVGNVVESLRIVSLAQPVLLMEVCFQLLVAGVLHSAGANAPFTISSAPRGELVRSGVYAIAEDIVAVDGKRGQAYRQQLQDRYLASHHIRNVCYRLDLLWGISGICVAATLIGVIFGVDEVNVGYALAWTVPFGYAGVMTVVTIFMVKAAKRREDAGVSQQIGV